MKKLTTEEQSLKALDKLLDSLSKEELQDIVNKIEKIEFEGPTIEEYFARFETHYKHLTENK